MAKFKQGDTAYIIENNLYVREVQILRYAGGLYLIKFGETGIRVKEHRLFATQEDAENMLSEKDKQKRSRTPYDWE